MQLGHLDRAAHVVGTFVDQLILLGLALLSVLVCVVICLNVCFDLAFDHAAHFVGDRVSVLDLAVDYPRRGVKCVKDGLSSVLADAVSRDVYVSEGVVFLLDKLAKRLCSRVSNEVSAQVQMRDHLSAGEELSQLFTVLVSELLLLETDHIRLIDAPRLDR